MSLNDPLANVLSHIMNCDKLGKSFCLVKPASKMIKKVLTILKENNMVGDFEEVESRWGGTLKVNLLGNINKCGVIKPRFSFTKENHELFEKRFLPAKDFGMLIVTTSGGVFTHYDVLEKGLGGKLLAYCY